MFKKFLNKKTLKLATTTSVVLGGAYYLDKKYQKEPSPLFLQSSLVSPIVYGAVGLGVIGFGSSLIYISRYIKCPPNKILVVYGGKQKARTIHGGGAFVIPIIQDFKFLSLNPMQIEINLKNTLSLQKIRVNVPSVFTVAIGTTPELMENAAQRMLELSIEDIKFQAEEIIYGQLRDVIASMTIESINNDRNKFASKVEEIVEKELHKLGLVLINVNFTDVYDSFGVIEALGKRSTSEAIQTARVEVAQKEKEGTIGEAQAVSERDIQVTQLKTSRSKGMSSAEIDEKTTIKRQEKDRDIEIEKANSEKEVGISLAHTEKQKQIRLQQRDLEIVIASAKSKQEVEISNTKLEQTRLIAEQEKETRIFISLANAEAIKGENDAKMQIEKTNATLNIIKAETFEQSEKKKKTC